MLKQIKQIEIILKEKHDKPVTLRVQCKLEFKKVSFNGERITHWVIQGKSPKQSTNSNSCDAESQTQTRASLVERSADYHCTTPATIPPLSLPQPSPPPTPKNLLLEK